MLPKGGGVVGVLGTLHGSRSRRLAHIQGSPTLGEAGRGSEWRLRLRGGLSSLDYPSQPCTWQAPLYLLLLLTSPIPRPPCIRPPHRKLFLINEHGKFGPPISSRDVLGSGRNQSCRLGPHNTGSEGPERGRVLLVPARTLPLCKGFPGPCGPGQTARKFAAASAPAAACRGQLALTRCAT